MKRFKVKEQSKRSLRRRIAQLEMLIVQLRDELAAKRAIVSIRPTLRIVHIKRPRRSLLHEQWGMAMLSHRRSRSALRKVEETLTNLVGRAQRPDAIVSLRDGVRNVLANLHPMDEMEARQLWNDAGLACTGARQS
jgi:hypothetical protein